MVDIIPSSQLVIGNGAFSIVYRARLKLVSDDCVATLKLGIAPHLLPRKMYGFMEFSLDSFHDCTLVKFYSECPEDFCRKWKQFCWQLIWTESQTENRSAAPSVTFLSVLIRNKKFWQYEIVFYALVVLGLHIVHSSYCKLREEESHPIELFLRLYGDSQEIFIKPVIFWAVLSSLFSMNKMQQRQHLKVTDCITFHICRPLTMWSPSKPSPRRTWPSLRTSWARRSKYSRSWLNFITRTWWLSWTARWVVTRHLIMPSYETWFAWWGIKFHPNI